MATLSLAEVGAMPRLSQSLRSATTRTTFAEKSNKNGEGEQRDPVSTGLATARRRPATKKQSPRALIGQQFSTLSFAGRLAVTQRHRLFNPSLFCSFFSSFLSFFPSVCPYLYCPSHSHTCPLAHSLSLAFYVCNTALSLATSSHANPSFAGDEMLSRKLTPLLPETSMLQRPSKRKVLPFPELDIDGFVRPLILHVKGENK